MTRNALLATNLNEKELLIEVSKRWTAPPLTPLQDWLSARLGHALRGWLGGRHRQFCTITLI
jgi:hypothetical protein